MLCGSAPSGSMCPWQLCPHVALERQIGASTAAPSLPLPLRMPAGVLSASLLSHCHAARASQLGDHASRCCQICVTCHDKRSCGMRMQPSCTTLIVTLAVRCACVASLECPCKQRHAIIASSHVCASLMAQRQGPVLAPASCHHCRFCCMQEPHTAVAATAGSLACKGSIPLLQTSVHTPAACHCFALPCTH